MQYLNLPLLLKHYDVQFALLLIPNHYFQAEARMLAKRQARAEAREIRMRELERQQKEQEENADRQFDMLSEPVARTARTAGSRYLSSRRSSEDSLEDSGSLRELRVSWRNIRWFNKFCCLLIEKRSSLVIITASRIYVKLNYLVSEYYSKCTILLYYDNIQFLS